MRSQNRKAGIARARSSRTAFPLSKRAILSAVAGLFLFTAAASQTAIDPKKLERHFMAPCCRHSLLADHFSPGALEMKDAIANYVAQGLSVDSIHAIYVAQYGEEILSEPTPEGFNRMSDIGPWAALALGACVLLLVIRSQRKRGNRAAQDAAGHPRGEDDEIERVIREEFDTDS